LRSATRISTAEAGPKSDGTYESYHGEYFIMMGTPDEIVAAAMVIYPF
jgi:hypothetical protein